MGNCFGGYQYGMGIADLFTGVPGLNTVWINNDGNFNKGCSCGGPNWGVVAGFTAANMLSMIGMSWIISDKTKKAQKQAEEKAAAKQYNKDLNNAVTMINPTDGQTVITIDDVKNVRSYNKNELLNKVTSARYDDAKLNEATQKVTDLEGEKTAHKNSLDAAKTTLENARNAMALDATNTEKQTAYKNAQKAVAAIEEALKTKKAELEAAQKEVKKYEEEQKAFDTAKQTVREAINNYADINDAKDAETLDDADGNRLNRTERESNKKYQYDESDGITLKNESNIEDMTASDWRGLINDYRTISDPTTKQAIAKFVKDNWGKIAKEYTKGDLGQGLSIIKNNV